MPSSKNENKEINPLQMKKAREQERSNMRNEDPYYRHNEEIIDYETLLEV